ncbi:helix-turn-helix domain-containing protein [Burkholderia cenocepacia]
MHELRHRHGHHITTAMRAEQTESGVLHRVGVYFLSSGGGGTC